ncbi:aminopeptidase P family protein [Bacillus sp. FJAT-49705]|uniref:Aminopeptidase P family protein n=1 Tax=Cytobacillus citreus TaxID=2833586 RepID=A0ABS5NWW7_9BACI|nr:Xaa-Pro peptidase family protein [Cytobacillus citreus]MBS4192327.1 aminopeptidase P family protein [Cytobacillus citreus]
MNVSHRISELRSFMNIEGIEATIVSNPDHQYYVSGFKALLYSRPIIYVLDDQNSHLIVPALEEVHAKDEAKIDYIHVYFEHPERADEGISPYQHLKTLLKNYKTGSKIGVDMASTPAEQVVFIRELGLEIVDIGKKIMEMRYVKDEEELKLIEEAGYLANVAVRESLNACEVGITEIEIDARGNIAVFKETAKKYPNATLDLIVMSPSGVERTIMPHVFSNTRQVRTGDIIIHSRQVALNGYRAELERTIVIGELTKEQKKGFEAAKIAQQAAMDFIKPGVTAAEVDEVSRSILKKEGFADYAIHRVGHGIGISAHEEPSLRFDNNLILKENMVFTIEPGIFIPGVGGFRHSDTLILTKNGSRRITEYPSELEDLTYS